MLIFETMFNYVLGASLMTTRIAMDDISSLRFVLHFMLYYVLFLRNYIFRRLLVYMIKTVTHILIMCILVN